MTSLPAIELDPTKLTPRQIVEELDKYIVGQGKAKRAVAIALRNRYRRARAREDLRDEITPKNILMIGPTGVGKTEIARRLAALVGAPFVKVEATKYTEVGYVGRDVESMVRDLVEASIRTVTEERRIEVRDLAATPRRRARHRRAASGDASAFGAGAEQCVRSGAWLDLRQQLRRSTAAASRSVGGGLARRTARARPNARRDRTRLLRRAPHRDRGRRDAQPADRRNRRAGGDQGGDFGEMLGGILPKRRTRKRVTVAEALKIFEQEEAAKLIDTDAVKREALRRAGEDGIIFIDEIDKVAGSSQRGGPDVSREGVQRDILPIVEGSTVNTKHGTIKTDHILFIAAGAFHISKPSDLIPELQGRLPIRVELDSLTAEDFKTILTQPKNALVEQYKALLAADGVTLEFREDAIDQLATFAMSVNERTENIGARRLHTVLERVLEDVSFAAPEVAGTTVVDGDYVRERLADVVADADLSGYIL